MASAAARQALIEAINAFERECGDDPAYREVKADLVNLEREVQRLPMRDDDGDSKPRKSFDDVAESHRSRVEERRSSTSKSDDDATSEQSKSGGGSDEPYAERPMGKRRG